MKILILLLLEFISSRYCSCSLLCELTIPSISLSPLKIDEVKRFLESQQIGPKLGENVKASELAVFKQTMEPESGDVDEDRHLNITELIHKYGFHSEEHHVRTVDGYILTVIRIPGKGAPVFLMHGFLGSADDSVTPGNVSALAYILALAGYDVWMGNARGNKYSRSHDTLSPDCADFWDYSFDDIGRYDLPAMIDFVLDFTCHRKLSYVGTSQGTTSFFVMASERPEYNDKISIMVALSPCAFMSHVKSPLMRLIALGSDVLSLVLDAVGQHEFLPDDIFIEAVTSVLCGNNKIAKTLCSNIVYVIAGFDYGQLNVTCIPVAFSHFPAGGSTKQILHYAQLIQSARFRRYDYGEEGNKEMYGCDTPPDYSLEKITAPLALFYSNNDWLANITDVTVLYDRCPNVVDFYYIDNYCHIGYLFANNVNQLVNYRILELIKIYL